MKNHFLLSVVTSLFSVFAAAQSLSLVADINTGGLNNSYPNYITDFNSKIYFAAFNGSHHKLYSSDGSPAGTELIGPTAGNGVVWYLTEYNNKLYFMYDDGSNGPELWTSDGTAAGTYLLKDIYPGANGSQPEKFTVCNGLLFFQASTPTRTQGLWVTDGTVAGTQMLGNQYSNPFGSTYNFIAFNNKIYFQGNAGSGYGMWSSDGTNAGTQLVKSGLIGNSGGTHAVWNNQFYFQSSDNTIGTELWKSDGTNAGTVLVKDINTVSFSSDPQNFFTDGQKVYFEATDGILGRELWATDGTNSGTQLVKDIAVGAGSSHPGAGSPKGIVRFNNQVYFFGNSGSAVEMYRTDGSTAVLVKSISGISTVTYSYSFNSKFYFVGAVSIGGTELLFESDGTTAGTFQISPAINTYSSNPSGFNMLGFGNGVYLPANFGSQGYELCKLTPSLGVFDWISSDEIKVYPNPTTGIITFDVGEEWLNSEVSIANLHGQKVLHTNLDSVNQSIDTSELASGIYLLTFQKNGTIIHKKIIRN